MSFLHDIPCFIELYLSLSILLSNMNESCSLTRKLHLVFFNLILYYFLQLFYLFSILLNFPSHINIDSCISLIISIASFIGLFRVFVMLLPNG